MDVTSLLNESATTPNNCEISTRGNTPSSCIFTQEKLSSVSLPTPSPDRTTPHQDWDLSRSSQNRKPWSADGYALPLRNEFKFRSNSIFSVRSASEKPDSESSCEFTSMDKERNSRMSSVDSTSVDLESSQSFLPSTRTLQNHYWDDTESLDPVGHKFSDSHSSLSSFASWRSRSHSRISSVTTLSGIHSTRQSVAELPLFETTLSSCSESYRTFNSAKRSQQPSNTRSLPSNQNDETTVSEKSGNPSDTALCTNNPNKAQIVDTPSRLHKRAISAPNFSPAANYTSSRQLRPVLAAPIEVMATREDEHIQSVARNDISDEGVRSHTKLQSEGIPANRAICSPPSPAVTASLYDYRIGSANPASNIAIPSEEDDGEMPVCMFVDDCDTGSQLRKAISHLFGRNKTCTLKIPKMVWVYYCRKHYQRVRYRNARTYPVTQMELVETQIERLKAWSDENQARGKGAYIKSWTLSLRKREEKRLKGNKDAKVEDDDAFAGLGASHVPSWIINELGDGFETSRVFAIAARLREEIESGVLNQVPEIEFLPDIVDDESEKDESKPVRHRRQTGSISTAKQPKRKASDFSVVLEQGSIREHGHGHGHGFEHGHGLVHGHGDVSYQTHHSDDDSTNMSPSGKRPRTVGAARLPHLQHHGSVDQHSAYVVEPSDSHLAPCYGFGAQPEQAGHPHPPRAQNIVPKMQPLDFTHLHHHQPSSVTNRHRHQGYGPVTHGHTRMSPYQDPREVSDIHHPYNSRHYTAPAVSAGHGHQQWGPETMGRRKSTSPPTLPSIATQMQGGGDGGPLHGPLQPGRGVTSMRPQSRGPPRPVHQRSASAYTPRCRFGSMPGRLFIPGSGDSVQHARHDGDHGRPASPISHGPARHGPLVHDRHDRHDWTSDYGHAPQYAQCQQQYSYGPTCMPSRTGMETSHEETSNTHDHNSSAYPEPPVGTMSSRSSETPQ